MRALSALLVLLTSAGAHGATVALVIDDLGHNRERARRALALPPPVAVAVLPEAPYSELIARSATAAGIDVLLHLPMEGHNDRLPVPGLKGGIPDARFRDRVRDALAHVPGAIGVNNHMGSVLTTDRHAMSLLMTELNAAPRPLLFLDSRTTPNTVAEAAAVEAGLGTTARDVFLDNDPSPAAIERQVHRWLRRARTSGCALAIGHPYPETIETLERLLPHIEGVRRVSLREYVETCGTPARLPARVATHAHEPGQHPQHPAAQ